MARIRLKYGNYSHPLSEAAVNISRQSMFNDIGVSYATMEKWFIQGRIEGDTQGEISTNLRNLQNAYIKQNQNIRLVFESGAETVHAINVNSTLDGVRVTGQPSYPVSQGAEYANYRTYNISVEAMVKTNAAQDEIVFWEEFVSTQGGRPRDTIVETLNTLPIKQRIADATAFFVHQTGRSIGLNGWPSPPPFILPTAAILNNRVGRRSPKTTLVGTSEKRTMFEISWNYSMAESYITKATPRHRPLS